MPDDPEIETPTADPEPEPEPYAQTVAAVRLKSYQAYSLDDAGQIASARLVYHVDGLNGATTATILRDVRETAPATIESAARDTTELVELPQADCCDVAVNYKPKTLAFNANARAKRRVGDMKWAFQVSSTETTVKLAKSQVAIVTAPGSDLGSKVGNLIGWNGKIGPDSQVAGCTVPTPVTHLTCRRTMLYTAANDASFIVGLHGMEGNTNNASFRGFAAGVVLFLGAVSGDEYENDQGDRLCDVSYDFALRPYEASQTIDGLSIPQVAGWDYLWTIAPYDESAQRLKVQAAVVSRVIDSIDFSDLGVS